MHAVIALLQIPFPLSGLQMICILWLEASALNEFATIGAVCLVGMVLFGEDYLDIVVPLIVGALNPDPLCLIYRWYRHRFPLV
jgi:hypothetical protein